MTPGSPIWEYSRSCCFSSPAACTTSSAGIREVSVHSLCQSRVSRVVPRVTRVMPLTAIPCSPGEIFCFESLEEYTTFFNGTIELTGIEETGNFTDPADVDALLAEAPTMQKKYEELGKNCLNSPNGRYLKYIGTAAAVRDMVSIANALDGPDAPINYFGTSYGSLLGSWFVNSEWGDVVAF